MKKFFTVSCILTVLFFGAGPVYAGTYVVDKDYSSVTFKINHMMGFVMGNFAEFDGTIEMDKKDRKLTALTASINTASIDTRQPMRDADLRSGRFFDVEKYPKAAFTVKKISGRNVTGDLTLHGVTKEVKLDYKFLGKDQDQYGRTKVAFSLTTTLNRQDFGITTNVKSQNGKPIIGDKVDLFIELYGVQK